MAANKTVWLPIAGYEGIYLVSYGGYVKNALTNKRIKPFKNENDYLCVMLTKGGKCRKHKLHRLVAIAHIPNPENKPQVNHRFGKKWDCRASQLEWNTQSENIKHAWDNGLRKSKKGCKYITKKSKGYGKHKAKQRQHGRRKRRNKQVAEAVASA